MEPTASRPAVPGPAPETSALAALLDCEADLDALERALLVAAVHPDWGAAQRAWLARWDERRGWLEGWRVREAVAADPTVAHAIARARRAPPGEDAAAERVRAWVATAEALDGALARAWSTGAVAIGPGSEQPAAPWAEEERIGVVPLRRGARPYGVLVMSLAGEANDATLAALATAADAALAAQSRAAEARRRARHLAALAEFARAAVSSSNVAEAVHALVRLAAQAVGVGHAAIYRMRENGTLALDLSHGPSATREPQARALQGAAGEVLRAERSLTGIGADRLPGSAGDGLSELSAWAFVPIVAYGVHAGVLAAWDGAERHPASPEWERGDLETLVALADQAALLFEHARRLEELTAAERRREDLASRLREQDRLAAVGELAARVAEDARQPLASVAAFVPIVAYGVHAGVLAAWDGAERHPASPEWERGDLETLVALADQAALLFEHARRLEELTAAERRREDLASRLREQDRLAAVGELAARVAEDARQPLASVAAFVARVLRELAPDDPRREYLDVVRREAERVDALLNEQLAYAKLEKPRLRMEALNGVVQEALRAAAEPLSRRRVRLVKKFAPDLPELLLDAERIRRVVANILTCALEAIPSGGRMRLETRRAGAFVVFDVVHDRVRQAGDALDQLFAPFGSLPVSGAALGLGVAQQIVREHGGEIRVKAQDEWSSVFSVTLPVLENQDRRRRTDRRVPRGERRKRSNEG